jgi:phosphoglycolate phosphatase-like HAD superfamily hydrolase
VAQHERDIAGLSAVTREIRQSQDRTFAELGELRGEQRRQSAALEQVQQHLGVVESRVQTGFFEVQRTLAEMQQMLSHITERLEGR